MWLPRSALFLGPLLIDRGHAVSN